MRKNFTARIGAAVLVLTLVSTCLLGGTFARYASDIKGTGKANIAKWSVKLKQGGQEQSTDFDFSLAGTKTANDKVDAQAVAPGDKGQIDIEIDGTGSEVAYEYKIALTKDAFTAATGNIQFYSDAAFTQPWTDTAAFTEVALKDVGTSVNKTIYWQWANDDTNNTDDTTAGTNAADLTFTVQLTAQQSVTAP